MVVGPMTSHNPLSLKSYQIGYPTYANFKKTKKFDSKSWVFNAENTFQELQSRHAWLEMVRDQYAGQDSSKETKN